MSEPIENGVKPLIDEPFYYSECDLPASEAFPEGWTACRPMLRVSLVHGDRSFSCGAIVDSGADYCCFPEWLMESLGIDKSLTKMEPNMHGSTGKIGNVYFYTVTIDLGFDKYPAYVCFHEGHPELAMLGRSDSLTDLVLALTERGNALRLRIGNLKSPTGLSKAITCRSA